MLSQLRKRGINMENKRLIELVNVSKDYDGDVALNKINLYIRDGEFLTLLGPSGCGKTTLLRLIAGFIMPSSGKIMMDGKDLTNVPPYKRRVNTVFQKYALFSHLNVFENVAFGLKIRALRISKFPLCCSIFVPKINTGEHQLPQHKSGYLHRRLQRPVRVL